MTLLRHLVAHVGQEEINCKTWALGNDAVMNGNPDRGEQKSSLQWLVIVKSNLVKKSRGKELDPFRSRRLQPSKRVF